MFALESSDRQEVQVRVQLKWRLEQAKIWAQRKGASEDIFDAIEEIAESLLRDAIAGQSYEECRSQAQLGYETIEKAVKETLEEETETLGGKLLSFEIRQLRFPLLEKRNDNIAHQKAYMDEKMYTEMNELKIEESDRTRIEETLLFRHQEEIRQISHDLEMQLLSDKERLQKMVAKAELDKARQNYDMDKRQQELEAQKLQQILELQQLEDKVAAKSKREVIEAKGRADEAIQDATAAADAIKAQADAKAFAKLTLAQSEAKAAELIGSAYRGNERFCDLQIARMHAVVSEKRAEALARAQMLPPDLQAELSKFSAYEEQQAEKKAASA